MGQTILRDSYLEQIKNIYHENLFLGQSFEIQLGDVTSEEAFTSPAKGLRTIAEFLFHIIAWRTSVVSRLEGSEYKIEPDSEKDWANPENLRKNGWDALLIDMKEMQTRIINALQNVDDEFLNTVFGDHGYKYSFLVEGMIHHDVYHLGQIGTVKKLLRSKNNPD
ncbi:hypothetical protein BH10BAC5_BH10BAC5_09950 [soil metagenome]